MRDAIASWWKDFKLQAPHIDALFDQREEWDLAGWMSRHLGAIHPQLMWEFGPAVNCEGNRLVITPEARRDLRPLVREILSRAPSLAGWEFYEYRLPEDFEQAERTVDGRTGGSLQGIQVLAQQGAFNRVDLTYRFPTGDVDEGSASNIAFVATEVLLGEETLDRWIGAIEVLPQAAPKPEMIDIADLTGKVQRLIAEIKASLPDRPWHQADEGILWTSFTCERQAAEEYAEQDDLFVGVTVYLPMLQNALAEGPFDSVRYSRFGECFCYLKIDGIDGLAHSDFADRGEIEDAINASLRPSGLGSVVGGGTGRRYSYIELALTDVEPAWQQTGVLLSNARLPKRTWLLFHDTDLSAQWHGLYDDTPNPPMPQWD